MHFYLFLVCIKAQSIHIHINSIVAFSYLVKMGCTRNKLMIVLSKEIWDYLLRKEIRITSEYFPGLLNVEADTQCRTVRDAGECWGTLEIDLFASSISHQLPTHISWKLDPYSQWRDSLKYFTSFNSSNMLLKIQSSSHLTY